MCKVNIGWSVFEIIIQEVLLWLFDAIAFLSIVVL